MLRWGRIGRGRGPPNIEEGGTGGRFDLFVHLPSRFGVPVHFTADCDVRVPGVGRSTFCSHVLWKLQPPCFLLVSRICRFRCHYRGLFRPFWLLLRTFTVPLQCPYSALTVPLQCPYKKSHSALRFFSLKKCSSNLPFFKKKNLRALSVSKLWTKKMKRSRNNFHTRS